MAYSKLHSTIVNSSLWEAPGATRLLFITMLAMCDRDGIVYGSRGGLSRIANIDPDHVDVAWDELLSPDKNSSDRTRAPENEGRRIEEVPGGFRLLNFDYYRGLRNDDDRREQNRIAQAKHKARVSQGKPRSAAISRDQPRSAHTETEAETESDAEEEMGDTPLKPPARKRAAKVIDPQALPSWLPEQQWGDFVEHRKAMRGVPFTDAARAGVIRELDKLQALGHAPADLLSTAVTRGWRTVFAPQHQAGSSAGINRADAQLQRNRAVAAEFTRKILEASDGQG